MLTTVVDDFFDVGGSEGEQMNLIQLVEEYIVVKTVFSFQLLSQFFCTNINVIEPNCRWDVDVNTDCCSEEVKIIFSAIRSTISEIGEKSVKRQGRNVKDNVIKIVRSFFHLST